MGKAYRCRKGIRREHRGMDGTETGSIVGPHAVRACTDRLSQAEWGVQARKSDAGPLPGGTSTRNSIPAKSMVPLSTGTSSNRAGEPSRWRISLNGDL